MAVTRNGCMWVHPIHEERSESGDNCNQTSCMLRLSPRITLHITLPFRLLPDIFQCLLHNVPFARLLIIFLTRRDYPAGQSKCPNRTYSISRSSSVLTWKDLQTRHNTPDKTRFDVSVRRQWDRSHLNVLSIIAPKTVCLVWSGLVWSATASPCPWTVCGAGKQRFTAADKWYKNDRQTDSSSHRLSSQCASLRPTSMSLSYLHLGLWNVVYQ